MAALLIGSVSAGSASGSAVTTAVLDTTGTNLLVVLLADNLTKTRATITDSKGNSWSAAKEEDEPVSTLPRCTVFYCTPSSVGSGHTFTATGVAGSVPSLIVYAFSGALASPLDQTNGGHAVGVTAQAAGSITPSANGAVIIAAVCQDVVNSNQAIDSGFNTPVVVAMVGGQHFGLLGSYLLQPTATAKNPSWSWTTAADAAAVIVSFLGLPPTADTPVPPERGFKIPPFRKAGPRLLRPPGSTVLPTPAAPSTPNTPTPATGDTASYTLLSWLAAGATKADVYLGTSPASFSYELGLLGDGPIANWRMNDASGSIREEINGLTGVVSGGVTYGVAGPVADGDTALQFDGTGVVTIADAAPLHLTSTVTTIGWFQVPTGTSGVIRSMFRIVTGSGGITIKFNGSQLHGVYQINGGSVSADYNGSLPALDTWHLIASTYDGAAVRLYLDGVLIAQTAASGALSLGTGGLLLGAGAGGFVGMLGKWTLLPTALSATEIALIYARRTVGVTVPASMHQVGVSYVPTVAAGTTYYWQVVAINDGGQAVGPIWAFTMPAASTVLFLLNGVLFTHVRALTIRDVRGAAPNTARLTVDTTAPIAGWSVLIGLGTLDADNLLFGGEIQSVDQSYVDTAGSPLWPASLVDDTFVINKRRPFGTWTDESATTIEQELVAGFAPGFTSTHVQADLPRVSISFDGQADFMSCLSALATAISTTALPGYTKIDYSRDVHLFLTETSASPDPIDAAHKPLNDQAVFTSTTDFSQLRTRDLGKGHGEVTPCDVAVAETLLPVASGVMYSLIGGQVIASITADGAQTERLTYGGVQIGVGGSIVGPSVAPSSAPTATAASGAGLSAGVYQYAYTWTTAGGETLPGPLATVTVGDATDPVINSGSIYADTRYGSSQAGLVIGDVIDFAIQTSYDAYPQQPNGVSNAVVVATGFIVPASTGAPGYPAAIYCTATFTVGSLGIDRYYHPMWRRGGGDPWKYTGISFNPVGTMPRTIVEAIFGASLVTSTPSPTMRQVVLSNVALGPTTPTSTTGRKNYRTVANGSQLKLQSTVANNTVTGPFTDTTPDASLGANAPVGDNSGLSTSPGQVTPGATSLLVASTEPFVATGGHVGLTNGQTARYTGINANSLTGFPASGPGAITSVVAYGSGAVPVDALTGVNANNGLTRAMAKGSKVNIFVQRDDLTAQAALAALEGGDGIREYTLTDERMAEATIAAKCDADLAIFSRPIVSVTYQTRDPKSKAGKTVHIDTTGIDATNGIVGDFVIQSVDITFDGPALMPRYSVTASSAAFTIADLIRKAVLTP